MKAKNNPNYDFLWEKFNDNNIRYIVLEGGTRSGKTYSFLEFVCELCHTYPNLGLEVAIARKTLASLKSTALKDFVAMLRKFGLYIDKNYNKTDRIIKIGSNTIDFFGADNDDKLRGFSCDLLYLNEGLELSQDEWLQLKIRTKGKIIIDYNPSENNHYLYDELDSDPNAVFLSTTYLDNPHLSDLQVREIEKLKDIDSTLYEIYAKGKRGQLKGLVFPNWGICQEMPRDLKKRGAGMDFGYTNDPTTLLDIGIRGNEIFIDELIYQKGLSNGEIAKLTKGSGLSNTSLIIADSAEPKSIAELKNLGLYIEGAVKGADSIRHSINLLKPYKLMFTARSVNAIKEAKNYKYKEKDGISLNEPIDAFNHCLDPLRYWGIKNLGTQTQGWGMS